MTGWSKMFRSGYVQAIEFTECHDDNPEVNNAHWSEQLTKDIDAVCRDFQAEHFNLLTLAYNTGYTEEQAGIDFWLTRNGHGAGFWDRDLGFVGDMLTKAAQSFGPCDIYAGDDGLAYAFPGYQPTLEGVND